MPDYLKPMSSFDHIEIPTTVPVMVLSGTVLFPHAVLPLYIFEERYRKMLADVLDNDRLFAIFNAPTADEDSDEEGIISRVGTVGMVRAAHRNPDGTSNLALQGIRRVRLLRKVSNFPYPVVEVEAFEPDPPIASTELIRPIVNLLKDEPRLAGSLPEEYVEFLESIDDPLAFIDVAAHALCQNVSDRQHLLELPLIDERYAALEAYLLSERQRLLLFTRLQGSTRDDEIGRN